MRLFQLLKDIILAIRNISNKYYYTSGTASGTYGATFVLCALSDLPKGVYLVQGHVNGGKDLSSVAMAADIYIPTGGTVLMAGGSRTTMIAGGGCYALIHLAKRYNPKAIAGLDHYRGGRYSSKGRQPATAGAVYDHKTGRKWGVQNKKYYLSTPLFSPADYSRRIIRHTASNYLQSKLHGQEHGRICASSLCDQHDEPRNVLDRYRKGLTTAGGDGYAAV